MARTTKQLSGGGKDKFLRALIADASLPADVATKLGDTMCDAIADIRVRREAWEPARQASAKHQEAQPVSHGPKDSSPAATLSPDSPAEFDPFVFSALAVLTKQGPAALASRLATIESAANLHALAKAQHLTVEAGMTDLATLRVAMITATEARLAERRAAAS